MAVVAVRLAPNPYRSTSSDRPGSRRRRLHRDPPVDGCCRWGTADPRRRRSRFRRRPSRRASLSPDSEWSTPPPRPAGTTMVSRTVSPSSGGTSGWPAVVLKLSGENWASWSAGPNGWGVAALPVAVGRGYAERIAARRRAAFRFRHSSTGARPGNGAAAPTAGRTLARPDGAIGSSGQELTRPTPDSSHVAGGDVGPLVTALLRPPGGTGPCGPF